MNIWSKKHDIKWKSSTFYSSKQNDISKRQNRTIVEKIRVMLADVDLLSNMWEEMFFTSVYLRNRSSTSRLRLRNINKTLYEMWTDKKFDLNHLRIIECDVWHHVFKQTSGYTKLSERAIKCRLLSYEDRNQYRL